MTNGRIGIIGGSGLYNIEGITLGEEKSLQVIKKVQREPFAYSFVVNARGEHYLECLTKTWNKEKKEFVLNEPTHPRLKIVEVDKDVQFDLPELEWEIYQKLQMDKEDDHNSPNNFHCQEYRTMAERYFTAGVNYIKQKGKNSAFIAETLQADLDKSRYGLLCDSVPLVTDNVKSYLEYLGTNQKKIIENLERMLQKSDFKRLTDPQAKLKRFELENKIFMQMMYRFYGGGVKGNSKTGCKINLSEQDKIIVEYQEKAKLFSGCAETAIKAVKSLTRYAAEPLTNYQQPAPKYAALIGNILEPMCHGRNVSIIEAVAQEYNPLAEPTKEFFLFPERINIANQLIQDLYYIKLGRLKSTSSDNLCQFVKEFGDNYLSNPEKISELIEKFILPLVQKYSEEVVNTEKISSVEIPSLKEASPTEEIPSPKEVEINKPIIGPIVEQAVELTKVEKTKLSLSAVLSYLRGAPQGAR